MTPPDDDLLRFEWEVARWKGAELVDRKADILEWCKECVAWLSVRHEVEVDEIVSLCPLGLGCVKRNEVCNADSNGDW